MTIRRGNPTDFESFLTWEALVTILLYDPATGEFRWREIRPNPQRCKVGSLAGALDLNTGYTRIMILGRSFMSHRLAWFYMKKSWPRAVIDHRNGRRSDNRWDNLREATRSQNGFNRNKENKNSKSGVLGVYPSQTPGKWKAKVRIGDKSIHLGTFASLEEAKRAREDFNVKHLGDFVRSA